MEHCWCGSITPMPSRTKFVILMHTHEFKRIKANTGRLTHLCLADSELYIGEAFDQHEAVQALINDPKNYPMLLYPAKDAVNLSAAAPRPEPPERNARPRTRRSRRCASSSSRAASWSFSSMPPGVSRGRCCATASRCRRCPR
jgi:hypothetical protein